MNYENYYLEIYGKTLLQKIETLELNKIPLDYKLPNNAKCIILKKQILDEEMNKQEETKLHILNKENYQVITSIDYGNIIYICNKNNGLIINSNNIPYKLVSTQEELTTYLELIIESYNEIKVEEHSFYQRVLSKLNK